MKKLLLLIFFLSFSLNFFGQNHYSLEWIWSGTTPTNSTVKVIAVKANGISEIIFSSDILNNSDPRFTGNSTVNFRLSLNSKFQIDP